MERSQPLTSESLMTHLMILLTRGKPGLVTGHQDSLYQMIWLRRWSAVDQKAGRAASWLPCEPPRLKRPFRLDECLTQTADCMVVSESSRVNAPKGNVVSGLLRSETS